MRWARRRTTRCSPACPPGWTTSASRPAGKASTTSAHPCYPGCVHQALPALVASSCHVTVSKLIKNDQAQDYFQYCDWLLASFLLTLDVHAGNWSERLLESMYYVTAQHGTVFPHEIERLWSTVAGNKRNIIPILDYVVSKGQQECGQVSLCISFTHTASMHTCQLLSAGRTLHLASRRLDKFSPGNKYASKFAPRRYAWSWSMFAMLP